MYNLEQKNWLLYGLLNFFATLAIYNFQRIYKASFSKIRSPWLSWVRTHKKYLLILTFASIAMIFALMIWLLQEVKIVTSILLFACVISFAYVVPLFGKSLREIPFIKSPMIAFVWVVVLFVFPAINEGISFHEIVFDLIAYYFFIIALTIPFDIRDLKYDDPKHHTLPMIFGINGAKFLAVAMLTVYFMYFEIYNEKLSFNILFVLANILLILLISFSSNKMKDEYFAMVDATMILVGLAYFL